jgi:hypothetical protein
MEERVNAISDTPLAQAIRDAVASGQLETASEDDEESQDDPATSSSGGKTQG